MKPSQNPSDVNEIHRSKRAGRGRSGGVQIWPDSTLMGYRTYAHLSVQERLFTLARVRTTLIVDRPRYYADGVRT